MRSRALATCRYRAGRPRRGAAHRGDRAGFTLIEVIVALAVAGTVALVGTAIFDVASRSAKRTMEARAAADAEANGLRVARALVDQVDIVSAFDTSAVDGALHAGAAGPDPVAGDADSVRLVTACDTPAGWAVRCVAVLRLVGTEGDAALVADMPGGRLPLRTGLRRPSFRYLATALEGGRWRSAWAGRNAPVAIGVAAATDTILLTVGARR